MNFSKVLLGAIVATGIAGAASAGTIDKVFKATSAVGSGADHSLWIGPGLVQGASPKKHQDFDFAPAGTFTLFDDGTATLAGSTVSQTLAGAGFDVNFSYDSSFKKTNGDSFDPKFKSENGSKEVLGETFYRNLTGGTLTGTGLLDGLVLTVSRKPVEGPEATQIGPSNGTNIGANNKNMNYGMANWFMISSVSDSCISVFCDGKDFSYLVGKQGDINVDLTVMPLPAGGMLLITGMAGFALARRRRKD